MPPEVVTVTSTVPDTPAGAVAVFDVAELTVNALVFVPPNLTAVAPVKPVPGIVTVVRPACRPEVGEINVMVGGAIAI